MASSREAFDKLRRWKKSSTVLRVTLVESGTVQRHIAQIYGVDEELLLVGLALRGSQQHLQLSLDAATFKSGERALEVERGKDDFVAFEEEPS